MDVGTVVAVALGVINIGLAIALALRKEGKEEANRRMDECLGREAKLAEKLERVVADREMLSFKLAVLEAKQSVWDQLLGKFQLVEPTQGGRRSYDSGGSGSPSASGRPG